MANFLSFYHEPWAFWTAYLAACLLIQNERCYFLAPQTLYKRGRVLGRERGGEGIL